MNIIDSFKGKYKWLSNFEECIVPYDGQVFNSSEAAYQSAKSLLHTVREPFMKMTPAESKKAGQLVKLRPDWDKVCVKIMREILWNKFSHNKRLAHNLIETGTTILIEGNRWNDTRWGVCNGKGLNWLGLLLMETRNNLITAYKGCGDIDISLWISEYSLSIFIAGALSAKIGINNNPWDSGYNKLTDEVKAWQTGWIKYG